jgi:hypothetical protein
MTESVDAAVSWNREGADAVGSRTPGPKPPVIHFVRGKPRRGAVLAMRSALRWTASPMPAARSPRRIAPPAAPHERDLRAVRWAIGRSGTSAASPRPCRRGGRSRLRHRALVTSRLSKSSQGRSPQRFYLVPIGGGLPSEKRTTAPSARRQWPLQPSKHQRLVRPPREDRFYDGRRQERQPHSSRLREQLLRTSRACLKSWQIWSGGRFRGISARGGTLAHRPGGA